MIETAILDHLTETETLWLEQLKAAFDGSRLACLPESIFDIFNARKWLEGEPISCKLNSEGVFAALRILGKAEDDQKAAQRSRRKH